jgi:hypothetical protein
MATRRPRRLRLLLVVALFTGQPQLRCADSPEATDVWPPSRPWRAITGIPDPPFGIDTTHHMFAAAGHTYDYGSGPEPYRLGPDGPYTHYVDHDHPDATDVGNPFGTHTTPRETVPNLVHLPAGSVVEIHGGAFQGPGGLRGMGTAAAPIFIRGAPGEPPLVTGVFRMYGDYYVIEGLEFDLEDYARNTITVGKYEQGARSNIAIRYNEFHGGEPVPTSSYQVIRILHHWNTTEVVSDVVIYGNSFHHIGEDRGDLHYDAVAVSVDTNSERVWIVDNAFDHIGGDSIQVACDAPDAGETYVLPNHIYVGRNRSHDNYENFLDLKLCEDVIASENEVFNLDPLNPSRTPFRYGPGAAADPSRARRNIWTLFNSIHDVAPSDGAFLLYDSDPLPHPTEHFYIGNVVVNAHNPEGRAPAFGAWNVGVQVYLNNLAYHCDVGFSLAGDRFDTDPSEQLVAVNNIVGPLHPETSRTYWFSFYGVPASVDRAVVHHNLYHCPVGARPLRWGVIDPVHGLSYTGYTVAEFQAAYPGKGIGSLETDPQLVDPANGDFHLTPTSPAVDAGSSLAEQYTQLFFSRYGLSISVDIDGDVRPTEGTAWDMGPDEYTPLIFADGFESGAPDRWSRHRAPEAPVPAPSA